MSQKFFYLATELFGVRSVGQAGVVKVMSDPYWNNSHAGLDDEFKAVVELREI